MLATVESKASLGIDFVHHYHLHYYGYYHYLMMTMTAINGSL